MQCSISLFDIEDILIEDFYDLQPSSFKFLLKNTSFQIVADSDDKIWAAFKTLDLDFLKKYLQKVQPDLYEALGGAACWGFTDAVKLLLSDYGVDPSASLSLLLLKEDIWTLLSFCFQTLVWTIST